MNKQIEEQNAKRQKLTEARRKLDKALASAQDELDRAELDNNTLRAEASKLRAEEPDRCSKADELIEKLKKELKTNRSEKILRRIEELRTAAMENARSKDVDLRALQTSYAQTGMRSAFRSGGLVDMDEYMVAYDALSSIEIPTLRRQMEIANENARNIFFTQVIGSIYCSIKTTASLFRERNRYLAMCPLDGNVFQIKDIAPAPAYKEEFEAILALGKGNPAQYSLDVSPEDHEDYLKVANQLFERLNAEPDPSKSELLDYRTYCSFGMEVLRVNTDTGIIDKSSAKPFEKWLAIGSGGQVELPIYIILGVALSNACTIKSKAVTSNLNSSDSIRLCIIDEALVRCDGEFSKMVLQFLTERLGLQLISIAPRDQFERLSYGVETVLIVDNDAEHEQRYIRQIQYAPEMAV